MTCNLIYNREISLKAEILKALGNEVRLTILKLLIKNGEMCVKEICQYIDLCQPKVSQHIGVLKELGIVSCRKEGVKSFYSVSNAFSIKVLKSIFDETS